jgi:hypothetical protein
MEWEIGRGKYVIIDDDDVPLFLSHKWRPWWCGNRWYAVRGDYSSGKLQIIYLHRLINKTPKGMETDHINGNGLDNRKCNLRSVTKRQNAQNKHIKKTSKYPGVFWHKHKNRWCSRIRICGKTKELGLYKVEDDAFKAYKKAIESLGEVVV